MEAFEKAAEARLDDWEVLNAKNRKVGTIHMGEYILSAYSRL